MKKKTRNIILVIIGIVLTIFLLNYFGLFGGQRLFAIGDVPTTGCGLVEQGQRGLEFQCTDKTCYVNGLYHCNSQTGEVSTIIFRYSGSYGTGTSFALSLFGGNLQSYEYSGQISSSYCGASKSTYLFSKGGEIHYGSGVFVCYVDSRGSFVARTYTPGGTANISPNSINPSYEVTSGSTNPYQCSKTYQWIRNGATIESKVITYSGKIEGDMETGVKQLQMNDIFKFDKINYVVYGDTGTSCSKNVCSSDGTGVYKCIKQAGGCNYLSKTIELCSAGVCAENQDGTDVECTTQPYYLTLSKTKTGTEYKDSFTKSESIVYEYKISSKLARADSLSFTLTTPTQTISLNGVTSPSMPFSSSVSIPNSNTQESGSYEITITAKYGSESYIVGKKTFNVAIPIYLSTRFYSIKGGSGVLYTNEPSYVQIDAWDSPPETEIKNRVPIKNEDSLARLNNGSVNYVSKDCSFGSCIFKYELNYPGIFSYEASAESLIGYKATVQGQTDIKQPYVKPEFTNEDKLECVPPNLPITITFQTKSPQGELLTSTNKITIEKPSGKDYVDVDCQTGDCSFDYIFLVEGGHKFIINSQSSGYTSYPSVESMYAYVKSDCTPPECTKKEDCISPKTCVNYKCVDVCDSWTCQPYFYFIVILGGVGILVLIIVLVLVLKRKKPEGSLMNI